MVWEVSGGGTALAYGAGTGRREPAVGAAGDEQRADGGYRSLWPDLPDDSARCAGSGGFAVRFPDRPDDLRAAGRLVRLDVRAGFSYSAWRFIARPQSGRHFSEENMILEDLQYRYEGLKQRIALVRSYL